MVIKQGEIYWVDNKHPHLVLQNDVFNASLISTVVVCSLTSNLKRAQSPGNVLLKKGEANLSKASVVNVSQIYTVNKDELTEKIGNVSAERMQEIIAGVQLLIERRIL